MEKPAKKLELTKIGTKGFPELFSLARVARTNAAIEKKFDKEIFYEVDSLPVVISMN